MTFKSLTSIPVIDAHVHVFPDAIFSAIWEWFDAHAWNIRYRLTAERVVETLFELGAEGMVLLTYAHKPGVSDWLNEFLGSLVARYPGTVGGAAVHPYDDDPAGVLRRAWDDFGLTGVKVHPHVIGVPLDDPSFFPIYEACLDRNTWINAHAGRQPSITTGYGFDVAAITGVDRVRNALGRYPDLKLVVPHLGIDQAEEFITLLDRYPGMYLDTTMVVGGYFDLPNWRTDLIRKSDRIMYGSDFPNIPYDVLRESKALLAMDLGEEALSDILSGAAARFFGLRLPAKKFTNS